MTRKTRMHLVLASMSELKLKVDWKFATRVVVLVIRLTPVPRNQKIFHTKIGG